MKRTRQVLSLMLIAILLVSSAVLPVAATGSPWGFSEFMEISTDYSGTQHGYTMCLQRFLMCLSTYNRTRLIANGGIDGYFGTMTAQITKEYQSSRGLTADGICGPNTWTAIESDLSVLSVDSLGDYFRINRYDVALTIFYGTGDGSGYERYYTFDENDEIINPYFHRRYYN